MRSVRLSLSLAIGAMLCAKTASADPPLVHATLAYDVRDEAQRACPDESAIREQVARRLGYDPFSESGDRTVAVTITRRTKTKGFHAAITIAASDGTSASRDLDGDGDRCDELAGSVVLAVSLALDPLHFNHPATPSSAPPPNDAPPPASEEPEKAEAPPPAPPTWKTEIAVGPRFGLGVVPSASLGPVVDVRVGKDVWSLLFEAGADLPLASVSGPRGSGSVVASLLRGGVGACASPSILLLCARVDLGVLEGKGEGITTQSGATFYADAAVAGGPVVSLGKSLRLGASAELLVPLARTTLYLDNLSAWTTPSVAAAFVLSLGYGF